MWGQIFSNHFFFLIMKTILWGKFFYDENLNCDGKTDTIKPFFNDISCDKTEKLKLWQNSNSDQTKKLKFWQLKNSKCDKTQQLKLWQNLKVKFLPNPNCEKNLNLKCDKN